MIVQVVTIAPSDLVHHRVKMGAQPAFKTIVDFATKKMFAIKVGETGRGRVQRFIPLLNIPCPPEASPWGETAKRLKVEAVRLRRGQHGWLGEVVEPEAVQFNGSLVLLDTGGGFRGYTEPPTVLGAEIIETGWYADGQAGRAGRSPALMILASGPARIEWARAGRLYGSPREWVAWSENGLDWTCLPRNDYDIASDAGLIPDAVMRLGEDENKNGQA